jgi:hypothetical protein
MSAVVARYEKAVAGRVNHGVPALLVTLALVLPLTIGLAPGSAAAFETPFLRKHSRSGPAPARPPRTEGAPG